MKMYARPEEPGVSRTYIKFTETIPGRLISAMQPLGKCLVFGCGHSHLPHIVACLWKDAQVTAYDTDHQKIAEKQHSMRQLHPWPRNLDYTAEQPAQKFDTVLATNVLHENPAQLIDESMTFLIAGGMIGVMDYDMKGMPREDFFQRWVTTFEEQERKDLGDDRCYAMHTAFGLDDCITQMELRQVTMITANGGLQRERWPEKGTSHFIYAGRSTTEH